MRLELRRRVHADHQSYHHDAVLIVENEEESTLLDRAFGSKVAEDGLIAKITGEVRLSDDVADHYVLLRPEVTS